MINEKQTSINAFYDRRSSSLFNKVRRALNDYWLIPVIVVYLQFYATIYPPINDPIKNLYERNIRFLNGISILYEITTNDFPYTLIGHFKEIVIRGSYELDIGQVSHQDLVTVLRDHSTIKDLYNRLLMSRKYNNTELGGILTLSYDDRDISKLDLNLYEIPSTNAKFSEELYTYRNSVDDFLGFISKEENMEFMSMLQINRKLMDNLVFILSSDKIKKSNKMRLIDVFIENYDLASQSAYLLLSYDFKNFIGRKNIRGRYIGFFHFHNSLNEPPSDIDIKRSFEERQVVFTLTKDGLIVYDIVRGNQKEIHLSLSSHL